MKIVDITQNNIGIIENRISPDILENLMRNTCFGLMSLQEAEFESETVNAAMIFEWKDQDGATGGRAEIFSFFSETQSAGEQLLREYSDFAREEGVEETIFELDHLTDTERGVLEGAGFLLLERESRDLIVRVQDLKNLKKLIRRKPPKHILKLSDIMWLDMYQGLANCMFHGFKGIVEDIGAIPMEWYEPNVSCCAESDERINGLMLVHAMPSGRLMPVMFACVGADYQKDLLFMLRYCTRAIIENYSPETEILIRRQREEIRLLTAKFFPGYTGDMTVYGERQEMV